MPYRPLAPTVTSSSSASAPSKTNSSWRKGPRIVEARAAAAERSNALAWSAFARGAGCLGLVAPGPRRIGDQSPGLYPRLSLRRRNRA